MNTTTISEAVDLKTLTIDASHSQISFVVRHMGFSKIRGCFESFEGSVQKIPGDLSTLQSEATIEAASITTGEPNRDNHLRTGDFLLVDEYPQITFRSVESRSGNGINFTLIGELTIRGVSQSVTLDALYMGTGTDPWGGTRVAFEARTTINRKDFGVNWNAVLEAGGFLVGDQVEIILEVQAIEQKS